MPLIGFHCRFLLMKILNSTLYIKMCVVAPLDDVIKVQKPSKNCKLSVVAKDLLALPCPHLSIQNAIYYLSAATALFRSAAVRN